LKKTSPKKKQISIKTSPKTSNPQVFKKTRNSTKKTSPNSQENRKVSVVNVLSLPRSGAHNPAIL